MQFYLESHLIGFQTNPPGALELTLTMKVIIKGSPILYNG